MSGTVAVFHPGTQHSWQTAMALDQLGRLDFFATSIFFKPHRFPYNLLRLLPRDLRMRAEREFRRFDCPGLDPAKVRTAGVYEWAERIAARAGFRDIASKLNQRGNDLFYNSFKRDLSSERPFAVWAFDSASKNLFEMAKRRGRRRILDRTIGDWRVYNRAMDAAYAEHADFFHSTAFRVSEARIDSDEEEYHLADTILTGSKFCAGTIRDNVPAVAARTRVLNYCFDERLFGDLPPPRLRSDGPVRFLFVGQAGVRKGIHLILKVFDRIPKSAATLTIVGNLQVPAPILARYGDRIDHRKTVPRADVPGLMRDADVFLLPSLFEGSAIVLYEALASGAALIQSSAAGDAVTAETGLLLDQPDENALFAAVMTAIEDRHRLNAWRTAAQAEANKYRFSAYRDSIDRMLDAFE